MKQEISLSYKRRPAHEQCYRRHRRLRDRLLDEKSSVRRHIVEGVENALGFEPSGPLQLEQLSNPADVHPSGVRGDRRAHEHVLAHEKDLTAIAAPPRNDTAGGRNREAERTSRVTHEGRYASLIASSGCRFARLASSVTRQKRREGCRNSARSVLV